MPYSLEVKNLSYQYGQKRVLNDISFAIPKGTFFVLLGLNGAGKSTIFSLITRLIHVQKGEVIIDGYPISNYSKALEKIGIVFQEPTLDLDLSVRQNLYYYGALKGLGFKKTLESISDEIEAIGLKEQLDTKVSQLNGGHRRRVEILRALINQPNLLLLDEATVGLDVESRFFILSYLRDLVKNRAITILWITHLYDEVELDDEVAVIYEGDIVEKGRTEAIISRHGFDNLTETFKYLSGMI